MGKSVDEESNELAKQMLEENRRLMLAISESKPKEERDRIITNMENILVKILTIAKQRNEKL